MYRMRDKKQKFYFVFFLVLILFVGFGYAILTETLTINNNLSYDAMKWDVGFSSVVDNGGTVVSSSSVSNDGKSITVMCDFGSSTSQESCIAKATIVNDSTFNVVLNSDPLILYDDTYIHTLTYKWDEHPTYENHTVLADNFIAAGETEETIITIKTKNLSNDLLPDSSLVIPVTIELDFAEWQGGELPTKRDLAILPISGCEATGDILEDTLNFSCPSSTEQMQFFLSRAKSLTIQRGTEIPDDAVASFSLSDYSFNSDSYIESYALLNSSSTDTETYFDVYIQSEHQLYANEDMSYWFSHAYVLEEFNGLELIDTSMTTNMEGIFGGLAQQSDKVLTLDLSSWDTSNVTNMKYMFGLAGTEGQGVNINVNNFDTSKVTDMSYMFFELNAMGSNIELDLLNFDTSNVINMRAMFFYTGVYTGNVSFDVSNFNTINVTDMSFMFAGTAASDVDFNLNLSNFDTTKVLDMSNMLIYTGENSTAFDTTLTIRNPNLLSYSNVFNGVAKNFGSRLRVNYTTETSDLVDLMLNTKSTNANVIKGTLAR